MDYMLRALELAEQASGRTAPNPMVGAVLVKNGRVVGEGFHQRAGGVHAEVAALQQAGPAARSATLYVNLEPCCHQGKTPPCTKALIAAGVSKVEMAMLDPNQRVSGRGRMVLEDSGIDTDLGQYEQQAMELNECFTKHITTGLPFVIAKWAMTLDGKLATRTGDSQWITSEASRRQAHLLRQHCGAVAIGVGTVLRDDPQLTVRHGITDPVQPLRIVLDHDGRTPLNARVLSAELPGRAMIVGAAIPAERVAAYQQQGTEVLQLAAADGGIDLAVLLQVLGQRGIMGLLVEGGSQTLASWFAAGLVDKVQIGVGPKIAGGRLAVTPVGGAGVAAMADALAWPIRRVEHFGDDALITAYPKV